MYRNNPHQPIYPQQPIYQSPQPPMVQQQLMYDQQGRRMVYDQQGRLVYAPANQTMQQPVVNQQIYPNLNITQQNNNNIPLQPSRYEVPGQTIQQFVKQQQIVQEPQKQNTQIVNDTINIQSINFELQKIRTIPIKDSKIKITTNVTKSTNDSLIKHDTIFIHSCLNDAIDSVTQHIFEDPDVVNTTTPNIYQYTCILYLNDYSNNHNLLINLITNSDSNATVLSKYMKDMYITTTDKYKLNLITIIDTLLTKYLKNILNTNTSLEIKIDSFMLDYIDLIQALSEINASLVEIIEQLLTSYFNNIVDSLSIYKEVLTDTNVNKLLFLNKVNINYIHALPEEYNLDILPKGVIINIPNVNNKTYTGNALFSVVDVILSNKDSLDVTIEYLVTCDKKHYQLLKSVDNKYFIRKMK